MSHAFAWQAGIRGATTRISAKPAPRLTRIESFTMSTSLSLLFLGATTTISLVAAIGAQGTFVLRQGILGRHITPIIIFCILSDALMIGLAWWAWRSVGCGTVVH